MSHDLHVEVTAKNKATTYHYHRVWNTKLFVSRLQEDHAKEGGTVRVISAEEYRTHTGGTQ